MHYLASSTMHYLASSAMHYLASSAMHYLASSAMHYLASSAKHYRKKRYFNQFIFIYFLSGHWLYYVDENKILNRIVINEFYNNGGVMIAQRFVYIKYIFLHISENICF